MRTSKTIKKNDVSRTIVLNSPNDTLLFFSFFTLPLTWAVSYLPTNEKSASSVVKNWCQYESLPFMMSPGALMHQWVGKLSCDFPLQFKEMFFHRETQEVKEKLSLYACNTNNGIIIIILVSATAPATSSWEKLNDLWPYWKAKVTHANKGGGRNYTIRDSWRCIWNSPQTFRQSEKRCFDDLGNGLDGNKARGRYVRLGLKAAEEGVHVLPRNVAVLLCQVGVEPDEDEEGDPRGGALLVLCQDLAGKLQGRQEALQQRVRGTERWDSRDFK